MPLFPPQVQPWALYDGNLYAVSSAALVTGTLYLSGIWTPGAVVLTALRCRFGAGGNGHFDIGIYDGGYSPGVAGSSSNLLAHSGSTATATGVVTTNLAAPLPLAAGRYWLAFMIDNAVDTVTRYTPPANGFGICQNGTVAFPLPAALNTTNVGGLVSGTVDIAIIGLLQGGWS